MVYVQERLVQVGQVQVVLGFVVLSKRLVFWRRKLAERRQVCVHVSYIEAMRLVEVTIPGKRTGEGYYTVRQILLYLTDLLVKVSPVLSCVAVLPWNDDSILVVLQLEGEGVLLGILSGRNASAGLRFLNVLHELEVHVECVGVSN